MKSIKASRKENERNDDESEVFCAIEEIGKQHCYVVPMTEVVCDPATIKEREHVKFVYLKKSREGVVVGMGKDPNVLQDICRSLPGKAKREVSFHADQPRKAALQQREKFKQLLGNKKQSGIKKQDTKAEKRKLEREKKDKKESAQLLMDQELIKEKPLSKQLTKEANIDDSSSESSSEDDHRTLASLKKKGKGKDINSMHKLLSSKVKKVKKAKGEENEDKIDDFDWGGSGVSHDDCNSSHDDVMSVESAENDEKSIDDGSGKENDDDTENEDDEKSTTKEDSENEDDEKSTTKDDSENEDDKKSENEDDEKSTTKDDSENEDDKKTENEGDKKSTTKDDSENKDDKKSTNKVDTENEDAKNPNQLEPAGVVEANQNAPEIVPQNIVHRNLTIYAGRNYKIKKSNPKAKKLHEDFEVYAHKDDIDDAESSKSTSQYVRKMTVAVYHPDALKNATPSGFPSRGKGRVSYNNGNLLPRLHPHGIKAIIKAARVVENSKKGWRPRPDDRTLKQAIATVASKFKTAA